MSQVFFLFCFLCTRDGTRTKSDNNSTMEYFSQPIFSPVDVTQLQTSSPAAAFFVSSFYTECGIESTLTHFPITLSSIFRRLHVYFRYCSSISLRFLNRRRSNIKNENYFLTFDDSFSRARDRRANRSYYLRRRMDSRRLVHP